MYLMISDSDKEINLYSESSIKTTIPNTRARADKINSYKNPTTKHRPLQPNQNP